MFSGTYTALVTPFKSGKLDEESLENLVVDQIKGGVDGVVPVGTTGESPTLDYDEHARVVECVVQKSEGKIKIIAGTGGNSTREAIHLTQKAESVGASASLQVAPYYNKPGPEGLFQHFKSVADATNLPIILYSIPGRCGISIPVDVVGRLAENCKNIVGIKEAGGDADRVSQLRAGLPDTFCILSGDDALTLPFMSVGARGVISVASNILPSQVSDMVRSFSEGNFSKALDFHEKLYPLFKNLFLETNPVPVKAALALMGKIEEELRLPLTPMNPDAKGKLQKTMQALGIIS